MTYGKFVTWLQSPNIVRVIIPYVKNKNPISKYHWISGENYYLKFKKIKFYIKNWLESTYLWVIQ